MVTQHPDNAKEAFWFGDSFIVNLFSTHPSLGRRVFKLEKLAAKITGIWR